MSDVRKVEVTVEGPFGGPGGYGADELQQIGEALMDALISLDAEDPFVVIAGADRHLRVQIVVEAASGTSAMAKASALIERAAELTGVIDPQRNESMDATMSARELEPVC